MINALWQKHEQRFTQLFGKAELVPLVRVNERFWFYHPKYAYQLVKRSGIELVVSGKLLIHRVDAIRVPYQLEVDKKIKKNEQKVKANNMEKQKPVLTPKDKKRIERQKEHVKKTKEQHKK